MEWIPIFFEIKFLKNTYKCEFCFIFKTKLYKNSLKLDIQNIHFIQAFMYSNVFILKFIVSSQYH